MVKNACIVEHLLDQVGLARPVVAHQGDISEVFRFYAHYFLLLSIKSYGNIVRPLEVEVKRIVPQPMKKGLLKKSA